MASDNETGQAGAPPGQDRRTNDRLRSVFDSACRITAPFFDAQQVTSGFPLNLSGHRALRENFPDLSQQDIAILLSAVKAFHRARVKSQPAP